MVRLMRRCAAVLALIILASGPANGLALAQGERPDLKIEVVGLDPANPRRVKVRVTNVGQWWADWTTATVEAVPAAAGAKATEQVPDLGPKGDPETASQYEFTYPLAAPCGGQKVEVRAVLKAATTFNGNTEANTANNTHTREVCAAAQPFDPSAQGIKDQVPGAVEHLPFDPAGRGIVVRDQVPGAGEVLLVGEHRWPGLHGDGGPWPALVLDASAVDSATRWSETGVICDFLAVDPPLLVGWHQEEDNCSFVQVSQTAVNFDLSKLDEVPTKTLKSAVLTFTEKPYRWRSGGGGFQEKGGCVEVLGRATEAWEGRDLGTLFPNERVQGRTPGVREWTVTDELDLWLKNLRPRHGFVLRGGNDNPQGDDNTSCLSEVGEITLKLTYEVPSN